MHFRCKNTFLLNYISSRCVLTCTTQFFLCFPGYSTVLTEMERRGRSWLLDVNANRVAVVTPDDQTLRRAVGRRSHPRRLTFIISTPSIVILLPTKWLILFANLHIILLRFYFLLVIILFRWPLPSLDTYCFENLKSILWFHIVLLPFLWKMGYSIFIIIKSYLIRKWRTFHFCHLFWFSSHFSTLRL